MNNKRREEMKNIEMIDTGGEGNVKGDEEL